MKLYDDTSIDNRGDFDDKYSEILETNLTDYESPDRVIRCKIVKLWKASL